MVWPIKTQRRRNEISHGLDLKANFLCFAFISLKLHPQFDQYQEPSIILWSIEKKSYFFYFSIQNITAQKQWHDSTSVLRSLLPLIPISFFSLPNLTLVSIWYFRLCFHYCQIELSFCLSAAKTTDNIYNS